MNEPTLPSAAQNSPAPVQQGSTRGSKLLVIVCVLFGLFGLTAASAAFWYQYNFHASPFKQVALTAGEQQTLNTKMAVLAGNVHELPTPPPSDPSKTIVLNEREINAWLQQQGFGDNFKFHIRKSGFGATILTPVDEDTPLLGAFFAGHTVRVQVAFNTKLDENQHLALSLADLNIAGISIPNDWMGGIKGMNLLATNDGASEQSPFVKGFAAGIKDFQVRDGELRVILND